MNDDLELIGLVENPSARRVWLLANALRSLPFVRAIELARTAEAVVMGAPRLTQQTDKTHVNPDGPSPVEEEPNGANSITDIASNTPQLVEQAAHKRGALAIEGAERDRLLRRLAEGAKNAELAAEFRLSAKQVQGIRMGCSREIASRREQLSRETAPSDQVVVPAASIEEVVRYLRQQDDVVVLQEDGSYLINGRFRMSAAELISRANRMRSRQRKPAFEFGENPVEEKNTSVNGHPLFWEKSPNSRPRS